LNPGLPRLVLPALLFAALAGCGTRGRPVPQASTPASAESTLVAMARDSAARAIAFTDSLTAARKRGFTRTRVTSPRALLALRDSLGRDAWTWVLKVNRVDSAHVHQGDTLIVPLVAPVPGDTLAFDLSPFPLALAAVRDTSRLLLVSRRIQAFAVYDSGRLVRWGPVSTGRRETPTPSGLYRTNWKDKERYSTVDDSWLLKWYVNLQNFAGVSLHEYELPGRPASHSCVRLLESDARWLYGWAETWRLADDRRTVVKEGSPVVVWGRWDWNGRAPWKRLPEDPDATTVVDDELAEALRILAGAKAPPDTIPPIRAKPATPARSDSTLHAEAPVRPG
jgi:hypothetical protein